MLKLQPLHYKFTDTSLVLATNPTTPKM